MTFRDRADAGRQLAAKLRDHALGDALVLALPRGGVEVGFEVARALRVPLDVIPVRKLGAPHQPELAIGAIAPGAVVLNEHLVRELGIRDDTIEDVVSAETHEMQRRADLFRSGRPLLDVKGKTVIVVDDGLATGATAAAAIRSARLGTPGRILLAVPVGARETVQALREIVDELVCLETPAAFQSVGQWYENFEQTSDDRVIDLLAQAAPARMSTS